MIGLFCFVLAVLASPFKSKLRLEAENAVLRHQLIILRRRLHGRVGPTNHDRWFFIQLYRWFPSILNVLTIIRPETLMRWHRAGFRRYWRWKSRRRGGRPPNCQKRWEATVTCNGPSESVGPVSGAAPSSDNSAQPLRLRADHPRTTRLSRKVLVGGTGLAIGLDAEQQRANQETEAARTSKVPQP
jgi:hypothetical protein